MALVRPRVSDLVPDQLPEFVVDQYPAFVTFLQAYYDWLDAQQPNFYTLRDLDETLSEFLAHMKGEVAPVGLDAFDAGFAPNIRLSRLRQEYLAKGSPASYRLMFRLLFGKEIDISYPGDNVLIASDGRWNQDMSIFVKTTFGDPQSLVGKIVNVLTGSRTLELLVKGTQQVKLEVENIVTISTDTIELMIDRNFFGVVSVGDQVVLGDEYEGIILPTTSGVTVLQPGQGFSVGQMYPITSGNGAGSVLKVKNIGVGGTLQTVEFVKYGVGYNTDFIYNLDSSQSGIGNNTAPSAPALQIQGNSGVVTEVTIIAGGSGYTHATAVFQSGAEPVPAVLGSVTITGGAVTAIQLISGGSGYASAPAVIITGDGTGAAATAGIGKQTIYDINETIGSPGDSGFVNFSDYALDQALLWKQKTAYALGAEISWGQNVYLVSQAGTTGTNPPTSGSGGGTITDGTVKYAWERLYGGAFDGTYAGTILSQFVTVAQQVTNPTQQGIVNIQLGSVARYPGYYTANNGFLDDAVFIQDSYYYQSYSYLIKFEEQLETFATAVKTLVHPAGTALFAEYSIDENINVSLDLQSFVKTLFISATDFTSLVESLLTFITTKGLTDSVTAQLGMLVRNLVKPLTDTVTGESDQVIRGVGKVLADVWSGVTDSSVRNTGKVLSDASIGSTDFRAFLTTKPLSESLIPSEQHSLNTTVALDDALADGDVAETNLIFSTNPYTYAGYYDPVYYAGYTIVIGT